MVTRSHCTRGDTTDSPGRPHVTLAVVAIGLLAGGIGCDRAANRSASEDLVAAEAATAASAGETERGGMAKDSCEAILEELPVPREVLAVTVGERLESRHRAPGKPGWVLRVGQAELPIPQEGYTIELAGEREPILYLRGQGFTVLISRMILPDDPHMVELLGERFDEYELVRRALRVTPSQLTCGGGQGADDPALFALLEVKAAVLLFFGPEPPSLYENVPAANHSLAEGTTTSRWRMNVWTQDGHGMINFTIDIADHDTHESLLALIGERARGAALDPAPEAIRIAAEAATGSPCAARRVLDHPEIVIQDSARALLLDLGRDCDPAEAPADAP
jgi:hypothetical protein